VNGFHGFAIFVYLKAATSRDQNVVTRFCLAPIFQSMRAGFFGAMDATINLATSFNAVTDYLAITVGTGRCQHVNRAFEAVKGPSFSGRDNLE
jgi:hypothetical protein